MSCVTKDLPDESENPWRESCEFLFWDNVSESEEFTTLSNINRDENQLAGAWIIP